jgi:drug/metabolite transporter (DMT)-like permease
MSPATPVRTRRLAYAAWAAVCLIWGTTYLGIKICLETMPPMLMGGLRFFSAGVLLAAMLAASGQRPPARRSWGGLAVLGVLLLGIGNGGVVWAEQTVSSGLAAVLVATTPFWMVGVEAAIPGGERIRRRHVAGLLVGFSGIVLLVWTDLAAGGASASGILTGLVALQVASFGWALGSSYSRRHAREENALAAAAVQMMCGGMAMLAAATVLGEWHDLHFNARTGTAFTYMVLVGAIGGFASYTYALKHLPVSTVSLYAYINPVIAVALGALLLDEPFTLRIVAAIAIILTGVALVQSATRRGSAGTGAVRAAA